MRVHINETGKQYTQSIVVEFEAIYDIPFGILRHIREKYNDPDIFKKTWMEFDNYTLRSVLYERPTYDPILPALVIKDRNVSSDIYNQIISNSEAYRRVLELSPATSIHKFLISVNEIADKNGLMLSYTILCKNQIQMDYLKKDPVLSNSIKILVPDYNFNLNHYDLLIVEQYENIIKYGVASHKPVAGRTIWIPEFAYNMDQKETNKPNYNVSVFVVNQNKVNTYEPYLNYTKPLG